MNRDQQFLLDMLLSAKIAVSYMAEKSRTDLENDLQLQDAIIKIDLDTVWDTLQQSLPNLIDELEKIISSED